MRSGQEKNKTFSSLAELPKATEKLSFQTITSNDEGIFHCRLKLMPGCNSLNVFSNITVLATFEDSLAFFKNIYSETV